MLPRRLATAIRQPSWRSLRASTPAPLFPPARALHSRSVFGRAGRLVAQQVQQQKQAPAPVAEEPPRAHGSTLTMLNRCRALVLDSTYQPIDVVNWQRAICLEISTKVDVLEYYDDVTVKAPSDEFLVPAVVRVRYFNKRGIKQVRVALNRHNIFMRDGFQCQYCGSEQHLTLDHVIPSSMGGTNSWENLVTCCSKCNSLKGSKTLRELKWKLKSKPREPSPHEVTMMAGQWTQAGGGSTPPQWDTYLQPLFGSLHKARRSGQRQQQQQQGRAAL